ncbi:glycosyltransferase family 39 protein [Patescibacteria group bacterium]|nr:glycosyltransferase family 39 protein [Patescibacteria group bacterium]
MMIAHIKILAKKYFFHLILAILALSFFIGASSFNYFTQKNGYLKWVSPDETANYIFTKLYGQEGKLAIFEKYNLYGKDIMHPRSFRSDYGWLKPVSFLGIVLIYGKIAGATSYKVLPYLTPFFGAIGIIYYYLLVKKIFGRRNALISAFLLASFPVYVYYSARSMFHNVLFIVLLIIGLYYSVLMIKHKRETSKYLTWLYAALAGGFIGLAIITRASELLWIIPMLIILWAFNIKKIGITKLIIFLSFLFLSILPVLYWNQILYGSPWRGGYAEMNQSISDISQAGSGFITSLMAGKLSHFKELLNKISGNIFHFGFHPRQSAKMFYHYFIRMFYWIFWPALLGLCILPAFRPGSGGFSRLNREAEASKPELKLGRTQKHRTYLAAYFVISIILLFYYGSWKFNDNPDPGQFTIGNSYTRYWLPIYLGALPFVSLFIIKLTRLAKNKIIILGIRSIIIILIFFVSIGFVLFGSDEGLIFTGQRQKLSQNEFNKVISLTENGAAIITQYHDKLFFPERKVIVGLFNDANMTREYGKLVNYLPLYYYNFTLPQKDFDYLNSRRLAEAGLRIEKVEQITSDFTLYRLYKK